MGVCDHRGVGTVLSPLWNNRETSRCVPESDYFDQALLPLDTVKNPIGTIDDLANIGRICFRHTSANFGKRFQNARATD